MLKEMPQNQKDRAGWYDRQAELPDNPMTKIKITPKAKGQLGDGFSKLQMPAEQVKAQQQTKSERASVGGRWPGPKGRVGRVLHGKASPSSEESFLKQRKNHEYSAK